RGSRSTATFSSSAPTRPPLTDSTGTSRRSLTFTPMTSPLATPSRRSSTAHATSESKTMTTTTRTTRSCDRYLTSSLSNQDPEEEELSLDFIGGGGQRGPLLLALRGQILCRGACGPPHSL